MKLVADYLCSLNGSFCFRFVFLAFNWIFNVSEKENSKCVANFILYILPFQFMHNCKEFEWQIFFPIFLNVVNVMLQRCEWNLYITVFILCIYH